MLTMVANPISDEPLATTRDAFADLNCVIGTWRSSGRTMATADAPSVEIVGTDRYEWAAGRSVIIHHIDVHMGEQHIEAVEVIGGWDDQLRAFRARSTDSSGIEELMHIRGSDGHWTITGNDARSELRIDRDGLVMEARWERLVDGDHWIHWMDMRFELIPA